MSYDDQEYGNERLGETYLEYFRRTQPLVFVDGEREDDAQLDQYMAEMDFAEVFPDVWVADSLRVQLNLQAMESVES